MAKKSDLQKRLEELDKLKAKGTIMEDEYATRRQAILASIDSAPTPKGGRGRGIMKWGMFGCFGIFAAVGVLLIVIIVAIAAAVSSSTGAEGKDVHVSLEEGASGVIWPGSLSDKKAKVTIAQIVDNATSANQFEKPAAGKKFYALYVQVENVGTAETTSLDWKLRDSQDGEVGARVLSGIGGELNVGLSQNLFLRDAALTPGGKAEGWVAFEIPADATVKWIRADPNPFVKNDLYFDAK